MKIFKIIAPIFLIISFTTFAQKELDEMPSIVGGIEQLAKNIKYPASAKYAGITGKVLVKAQIDAFGIVTKTEIVDGVNKDLDAAAIKAVKDTKFNPGIKDGKNVKSEVTIPIKFKLDGEKC